MPRIIVVESVTLDGVMQAPAAPDEDTREGFVHGGWALPYQDEVMLREMSDGFGTTDLLFGRRTYEQFFSFWPKQTDGNPFTEVLNATRKHVASRTLRGPLPWENSVLLSGDAATTVSELKRENDRDLVVLGSGELAGALFREGLVDTMTLSIHPITLGSGRRLLPDEAPRAAWRLTKSVPTTTGVVIATYELAAEEG